MSDMRNTAKRLVILEKEVNRLFLKLCKEAGTKAQAEKAIKLMKQQIREESQ